MLALETIRVASPCNAAWDEMTGTDRVRFCHLCQKNVYSLSQMTRRQAEALVEQREGSLCVRLYRRADGTVLTEDCPVGLRAVRRQAAVLVGGVAAGFLALVAWSASLFGFVVLPRALSGGGTTPPIYPGHPPGGHMVMGDMCPPVGPPPEGPVQGGLQPPALPGQP
jgi:hypothetical protein